MLFTRAVALFIFSLLLFSSCSNSRKVNDNEIPRLINSKLFADRGIDYVHGVVMLRLKRAPLLKTAMLKDGVPVINEDEKNKMIKEQEEVLARLKKISDKIELIYSYKLSFNGIAVLVPAELSDKLDHVEGVASVQPRQPFYQIETPSNSVTSSANSDQQFSFITADFIGARKTQQTGAGVEVAIFDTGIDYTHAMFQGPGTKEAFASVDPTKETSLFPNSKVVGGIDLVGENFTPWSVHAPSAIPRMDNNPIDQRGHGSHVAGTVAGLGDGVKSHDGIAPDAKLYAIKVFGAGGTGDDIVIAGIEWCLDPNGDYDLSDMIDVGNMSLGGGYGRAYNYYSESINNATDAGFVVVASAGNSGPIPYIVGSPGASSSALSVGATIGGMDYLWRFDAASVELGNEEKELLVEIVEGTITTPVKDRGALSGELVLAGVAASDFSDELKQKIAGNIALIDRGEVSFVDKLQRALDAKAKAAIIVNNKPGEDAFRMGGEGSIDLPAIMITKEEGDRIKEAMDSHTVRIAFNTGAVIEKPEFVDTITGFSSQGPRFSDGLFKPEVTAPGYRVISANVGGGDDITHKNGTSMSAPQVAGVMALLRQAHPSLSASALKSLVIGTAKTIHDEAGEVYPLSRQGAGRVQADLAIASKVYAMPATISLGFLNVVNKKTLVKKVEVHNISQQPLEYDVRFQHDDSISIKAPGKVTIPPSSSVKVDLSITIHSGGGESKDPFREFDFLMLLENEGTEVLRVPGLGTMRNVGSIKVEEFNIAASNMDDADQSVVTLNLRNSGKHSGHVELFNYIGRDKRKVYEEGVGFVKSRECDLQAVGHRIVQKNEEQYVQFGIKLHRPTAVWDRCEVSVLFDNDGDGVEDMELGGALSTSLSGLSDLVSERGHYSILVDSKKAKEIRLEYEKKVREGEGKTNDKADYKEAVKGFYDMTTYNQSTVSVIEVPVNMLKKDERGMVRAKFSTLAGNSFSVESDDFLGIESKWHRISIDEAALSYHGFPAAVHLDPGKTRQVQMIKGSGTKKLMLLLPSHLSLPEQSSQNDKQISLLRPTFLFASGH